MKMVKNNQQRIEKTKNKNCMNELEINIKIYLMKRKI